MIIDTSALLAIVKNEPEAQTYAELIAAADLRLISAANYVEAAIVVDRSADPGVAARFDEIIRSLGLEIVGVSSEQAMLARRAHAAFGRGSGHPARLNYGDCFAYALAKERNEPLLYKGSDFALTDIPLVGRREERHRISEALAAYAPAGG